MAFYSVSDITKKRGYKNGSKMLLKINEGIETKELKPSYPFYGMKVPVEIIKEYPYFVTCRILPHNLSKESLSIDGLSSPYTVSISKIGLLLHHFTLEEYE